MIKRKLLSTCIYLKRLQTRNKYIKLYQNFDTAFLFPLLYYDTYGTVYDIIIYIPLHQQNAINTYSNINCKSHIIIILYQYRLLI